MTQQQTPNPSPVPTSQRPFNGAVLSGAALLAHGVATAYGAPEVLAIPGALAVGAILSTVGDAARGRLERRPGQPQVARSFLAEVLLKLFARAG